MVSLDDYIQERQLSSEDGSLNEEDPSLTKKRSDAIYKRAPK